MTPIRNQLTKIPLIIRVVSLYVLVGMVWSLTDTQPPVASAVPVPITVVTTETAGPELISDTPARIIIARIGIDLPVQSGVYDSASKTWSLSDDTAFFATMTALPNNRQGNTFIYGHNTWPVFEKTSELVPGDTLDIIGDTGKTFRYTYTSDTAVSPQATEILNEQTTVPRLTLMTCKGWQNEERRLMYFAFKEVR